MKLSQAQLEAIHHNKGPGLVVAGPGSGKTMVITQRVSYLVEEEKVLPQKIVVVTFTKAAATEMRERFYRVSDNAYKGVVFSTFHGIFYHILRHTYSMEDVGVASEQQKKKILREILEQLQQESQLLEERVASILEEISKVKNNRVAIENFYSLEMGAEIFRQIYHLYQDRLKKNRLIDFDDMLLLTYQLLRKYPKIAKAWQDRIDYLLVDEFQDINPIQYDILRILVEEKKNIFIVGDDDQSIYGFRGAAPEIMLRFEKDFPGTKIYYLSENYRCSGAITKGASRLIGHNQNRFSKDIYTQNPKGDLIYIHKFKDNVSECKWIVEDILAKKEEVEEVAILYRTHVDAHIIAGMLMEYNISFSMKDRIPNIYEHWIAKDILAYIHLAMGEKRSKDMLRIMNRPLRYIKREAVGREKFSFEEMLDYYEDVGWMQSRIEELMEDIDFLSGVEVYRGIAYIRKGIGYDKYLEEYSKEKNIDLEELMNILRTIHEQSRDCKTYEAWIDYIQTYQGELEKSYTKEEEWLSLSTLHGAKGLEYDEVYILDVNEESIPYKKADSRADIEEERRLLYVGMTRAKKRLHLSYVENHYNHPLAPSRFLQEIIQKSDL